MEKNMSIVWPTLGSKMAKVVVVPVVVAVVVVAVCSSVVGYAAVVVSSMMITNTLTNYLRFMSAN